jgi:Uri superfamily endonuclease
MEIELPEDKGTYILLAQLSCAKRVEIGRLGEFDLVPGFYAYVGSAHGAGGLRARIQHHLGSTADPHWHIDYLLRWAVPAEVWYAIADRKLEQDWAEFLEQSPLFYATIPRFGASDYRRSRTTHLFFTKRRPSFSWFRQQMVERIAADIRPQVALIHQRA